jgi:hypothetical protein
VAAVLVAFLLITMMHVVLGGIGSEKPRHTECRTAPALSRWTATDPAYRLTPVPLAFRKALKLDFEMHGSWGNLSSATHGG